MFDVSGQSDSGGFAPGDFDMLTDALRAGPGTPEWIRAVQQFKNGRGDADLHALFEARQRLESGKAYRALETTPRLTETVLASVAAESAPRPHRIPHFSLSSRTAVALLSVAATLLVVIGGLILESRYLSNDSGERVSVVLPLPRRPSNMPNLAGLTAFENVIPISWKPIGSLRVEAKHGLRLAGGVKHLDESGGIVLQDQISTKKPFKVQARLRCAADAAVSPEIFLTDDGTFDDNVPTDATHEFVWTVMNDRPQLRIADRSMAIAGDAVVTKQGQAITLAVDIKFDGANATVETSMGGHCTHWTGAHHLAPGKPLWMGMRFVVHGTRHDDCVAVETVRLTSAK